MGNRRFLPAADPAEYEVYAGPKREFLALAPWVGRDASRAELERRGEALAPGSGARIENDYLETALIADLPYPRDRARPNCRGVPAP